MYSVFRNTLKKKFPSLSLSCIFSSTLFPSFVMEGKFSHIDSVESELLPSDLLSTSPAPHGKSWMHRQHRRMSLQKRLAQKIAMASVQTPLCLQGNGWAAPPLAAPCKRCGFRNQTIVIEHGSDADSNGWSKPGESNTASQQACNVEEHHADTTPSYAHGAAIGMRAIDANDSEAIYAPADAPANAIGRETISITQEISDHAPLFQTLKQIASFLKSQVDESQAEKLHFLIKNDLHTSQISWELKYTPPMS